ncbi:hypothetical protein [Larkinella soli]|uniref:hypothetical protein n=1 Tax=Larkinella soli TaxID=1770527 RepID=UPI000FFC8AD1|nr:hypothetical protein [Larkinella soli]
MKRSILFGVLFLCCWNCTTDLEPRLKKSRLEVPTPAYIKQKGVRVEYTVVYGIDGIDFVFVSLEDTPPFSGTVDGKQTVPDRNGKGEFTIANITTGRKYEFKVTARHKDKRVPDSIVKGFITPN